MKKKGFLGLLLAGMFALAGCGSGGTADTFVLKIDNHEITKYEYMVYLYTTTQSFVSTAGEDVWNMDFDGQTADELVEERTISTLQSVLAAEKYAAANDITLTDEQKEEAAEAAKQFLATVDEDSLKKMDVDEEKLVPLMEASYLYSLVYDAIAAECTADETDLANYYAEQKDEIRSDYTQLKLATIVVETEEKAEEVLQRAKDGEDFTALFREFDIDAAAEDSEETGETTMYQGYALAGFGLNEVPEVGEVVGPIQMEEGRYFVIKLLEKTVPTEDEVKTKAEALYQQQIQAEYAEKRINEMIKTQQVEKVKGIWDTLEKFH